MVLSFITTVIVLVQQCAGGDGPCSLSRVLVVEKWEQDHPLINPQGLAEKGGAGTLTGSGSADTTHSVRLRDPWWPVEEPWSVILAGLEASRDWGCETCFTKLNFNLPSKHRSAVRNGAEETSRRLLGPSTSSK